ncbi:transcription initiation factor IIIB chain BRF [Phakopsora pachyrhizi]|uniref:B-related factor 1 n=1 Tax=Phakopsora pachyrhizi TaxID=170000 RepID=A0AAV0BFA9_PHAPC|nr:transcription initiation factor IIIB chain BRF [Phakopsora pachyrhizi]KAI8454778.1 transcription initiation factor IIIB chain BRF [Phakopsora pachyrhizi]CAH7685967.1 transcription initiation factor IIIB chain BRF [Phakopsora pachyrhizi]
MSSRACPVCGDAAVIEYDSAAGNVVCTTCGYVVDENTIVADITFGESSAGAAILQGTQLGTNELRARTVGPRGRPQQSTESRTQTLENGLRKLMSLTQALRLPDSIAESAHRFFTLAVSNGFVMGRRSPYVLASCVYVACRMAKLPTMLIDISDLLQVNVFIVGATYLKLVKELCLQNLPLIDPSIYISRFASLLEFGEETHKVAYDATRLIKRFDQDWMNSGRRPAGLVGASLLISARMNGFRRSILEIVQVVKMADVTIKKRLDEFKVTASGQLTVEEFRNEWLDASEDPPAFKSNLEKRKKEKEKTGDDDDCQVEGELQDRSSNNLTAPEETVISSQPTNTQDSIRTGLTQPSQQSPFPLSQKKRRLNYGGYQETGQRGISPESESESLVEENVFDENNEGSGYEKEIEGFLAEEVESHLSSGMGLVLQSELDQREKRQREAAQRLDDTRLDDLDEAELDRFILNDREVEIKTRVWMELNKEYLEKLADKREREASGELKAVKKYPTKPKSKPRDSDNPAGSTVEESVRNMINSKKKFSSKINYQIANSLFGNKSKSNNKGKSSSRQSNNRDSGGPDKGLSVDDDRNGLDGHESLLSQQNRDVPRHQTVEEEDDDEEEEEEEEVEEEEEIVDDAEFAMMKRDNIRLEEDENYGWEEA